MELDQQRITGKLINDNVDEHLVAIEGLVRGLEAATATYRTRPRDWADITSLTQIEDDLDRAIRSFLSAGAAAEVIRAARQVATEVHQLRVGEGATR